jgi:hypothetical protein
MGADMPDDRDFVPLIRDHGAADQPSYDRCGFTPVNHYAIEEAQRQQRLQLLPRAMSVEEVWEPAKRLLDAEA